MASRQEFAPWDGRWLAYDWFKLLIGLLLLLLLMIAWLTLGGPAPALPRLRVPVVSVPAPDATVDVGGVTFSGDATPGSTVQLLIDGQPAGTVVAAPSGAWSLLIRLDRAGTYNVVARAIRPGGAVAATSAPQRMTVVATVPAISAPTLVLPGAAIPGNVMFSGAGAPGTTVEVLVDGRPLGRTTVGTDGRWSLAGSVPAGELQIVARALDATGAPAAAAPPATLFVAAPPVITSLADGAQATAGRLTIGGTGQPGSTIEIRNGTRVLGVATVGADGTWSFVYDAPPGDLRLTARIQGNDATASTPVRVTVNPAVAAAPPVITSLADGAQATAGRLTIGGTGQPGSTIEIRNGTRVLGVATVGADGAWSFVYDAPPGDLRLTARIQGNDATASTPVRVTVNPAVAAAPPVITSLADGAQATAGRLTIGGTGQPGSTIEIRNGTRVLGVATVGADGTWSFVYDAPPGDLRLTARIQGNDATASTPVRVTVNPAVAAAPPAGGTTGAGGTGSQTGAQPDIPAALPNTGTADNSWSALIVPATILLAGGLWLRGYLARRS